MERRVPTFEDRSPIRSHERDASPPPKIGCLSAFIGINEPSLSVNLTGLPDEYDPLHPNEYEEFSKKRRDERRAEERKKDRER